MGKTFNDGFNDDRKDESVSNVTNNESALSIMVRFSSGYII